MRCTCLRDLGFKNTQNKIQASPAFVYRLRFIPCKFEINIYILMNSIFHSISVFFFYSLLPVNISPLYCEGGSLEWVVIKNIFKVDLNINLG